METFIRRYFFELLCFAHAIGFLAWAMVDIYYHKLTITTVLSCWLAIVFMALSIVIVAKTGKSDRRRERNSLPVHDV